MKKNNINEKLKNRETIRTELERFLGRTPEMGNPIQQEVYLCGYKRFVLRWIDCAPEGAVFLPAPLMDWDGTAFRTKDPQGPFGSYSKELRAARIARGLHPLGGRFDKDGNRMPPKEAYNSPAGRMNQRKAWSK